VDVLPSLHSSVGATCPCNAIGPAQVAPTELQNLVSTLTYREVVPAGLVPRRRSRSSLINSEIGLVDEKSLASSSRLSAEIALAGGAAV
jgi:hypothetical protein